MALTQLSELSNSIEQPIDQKLAQGKDLREDSALIEKYYALKEWRNEARLAERKAEQDNEEAKVDQVLWGKIASSAQAILQKDSKDIEIACWLLESLVRINGFSGFAAGIDGLTKLLKTFWPDVYPTVDDEDLLAKLNAIAGLDGGLSEGALIKPLRMVTLAEETKTADACALWQFQQAEEINQISNKKLRRQRMSDGAPDLKKLNEVLSKNTEAFLLAQQDNLQNGLNSLHELNEWLEATLGKDAPSLGNIRVELKQAADIIDKELARRQGEEESNPVASDEVSEPGHVIETREHMIEQIERIAQTFAEREPHSPIPSLLLQAVRWANLSLSELMQEMLQNPGSYQEFCRSAGFPPNVYSPLDGTADMSNQF